MGFGPGFLGLNNDSGYLGRGWKWVTPWGNMLWVLGEPWAQGRGFEWSRAHRAAP